MSSLKGFFLVPTAKNPDTGLWLIFHHESEGILACDLTTHHPDIPFRHFESTIDGKDTRAAERTALRGGPLQDDSAMLIFHDGAEPGDNIHILAGNLAFQSYRLVLKPGKAPEFQKADETPTRVTMAQDTSYIVVLGFRLWEMDDLEEDLKNWQWTLLPATPDILFHTRHEHRLENARRVIN